MAEDCEHKNILRGIGEDCCKDCNTILPRAPVVAPQEDELRLLLRRVSELTLDEGFSSHYQGGFENFRDQMTAVIKARLATASSPASSPVGHDWHAIICPVIAQHCQGIQLPKGIVGLENDLIAALQSSSSVPPEQDDGWVTFGRVKVDIENETETFERIQPPAKPLCMLCGHNGVAPDGMCMVPVPICSDDYHGTRRCGCKCRFPAAMPERPRQIFDAGFAATPTPVEERRHRRLTHEDDRRIQDAIDSLPECPTEEEAEAVLQLCGTSGKEVVNGFIDRLLKDRSEMQAELDRLRTPSPSVREAAEAPLAVTEAGEQEPILEAIAIQAADYLCSVATTEAQQIAFALKARVASSRATAPPSTSEAIRAAAEEWMNTWHGAFATNKEREDALVTILSRWFGKGETEQENKNA